VIDHVGFEVTDLQRATRFYDPVFHALGARRIHDAPQAVAYGVNGPTVWFVDRGLGPGPAYGHLALQANGKAAVDAAYEAGLAHGGTDRGAPGATTPPTWPTPTVCASRSSPAADGYVLVGAAMSGDETFTI
jgi:catechol 2,3-dioxygenase-like lactoylglutathione lyase family enzyme